jgi:hypothetical protein
MLRRSSIVADAAARAMRRCAACIACALAIAAMIAGCATAPPPTVPPAKTKPIAPNVEPPPPNVNLSGFPLPYRQGYADGCASAGGRERKDSERFASDGNYRTGWQDGVALCKKK